MVDVEAMSMRVIRSDESNLNDPVVTDSRVAFKVFALALALLLVGAVVGLNPWPAQALFESVGKATTKDLFLAFHGYTLSVVVLFWGSRPSRAAQVTVLASWAPTTLIVYWQLAGQLEFGWSGGSAFPYPFFLAFCLALPCLAALIWRIVGPHREQPPTLLTSRLKWLTLMVLMFTLVPTSALMVTSSLHPQTFDMFALQFDRAAGLNFTPALVGALNSLPPLAELVLLAYALTPAGFLAIAILHLRGKPDHVASALLTWVVLSTGALLAYHAFPITGPYYLFGSEGFAAALKSTATQPLDMVTVPPFPRNGFPSMHFGWMLAASVLWWRTTANWWSRGILITMTALVALATLYKGEHYVIDLIVAVPFVLAAISLSTTGVSMASAARRYSVFAGVGTWLVWVALLRTQAVAFIESPWLCWLLIGATALVAAQQSRWIARFAYEPSSRQTEGQPLLLSATQHSVQQLQFRFGAMFFVSGMAALTYQVLFAKELALVFGSTAAATFTVLATFLGGMALGSVLGGQWAHRLPRPLRAYALVEVGIAVCCVATPGLFDAIQTGYVVLAAGQPPDAPSLMVLRVLLGAAVLLVPTVLMGATLPMLVQAAGPKLGRIGERVAWLYFTNTAGAALGALLTAYFIIPALGAHRTTLVSAMLNLMVALGALELAKSGDQPANADSSLGMTTPCARLPSRLRWAALTALGIGGLLSLGLEVVYVHMLAIVAGNSVYAFGLMVATFLVGLSMGGEGARRWLLPSRVDLAIALAIMLLGLCLSVTWGGLVWNGIPDYFAGYANYPAARTFASREVIRGLVCCGVMIPPTLFIGGSYVIAMDMVTASSGGENSVALGWAAAVNTLGNIAGVLLFGFVLLPLMGGLAAGRLIALCAFALAVAVILLAGRIRWPVAAGAGVVGATLAMTSGVSLDYGSLSSGANVYFQPQRWGEIIDHAESIDGGLTTVARQDSPAGPVLTLLTNGKFQGNDALAGEMQAQVGFALAPLLHQERRDRALVIGYGTGVTTRVFHEAGFKQVEVAELSRDIVRTADQHFAKVNRLASQGPGVTMRITDGRNLLLLSRDRYDVISLEITSIWFAGAASLYNQEFYQLARARMQPDGVLQQWMQMHHLSGMDLLHIMATLRSEFKYVSLYLMGSQGILVATNSQAKAAANPVAMQALRDRATLADALAIAGRAPEALAEDIFLKATSVDRFLTEVGIQPRVWISTDDNLRLEYDTPRGNVNDAARSFADNKALLERFR